MSSSRGRFVLLAVLSAASALYGCSSNSDDDDDDDGGEGGEAGEGSVLGGGTGGGSAATGGSVSASGVSDSGGTGGTNPGASGGSGAVSGTGGTGTSGSGNDGAGGSSAGKGGTGTSGSGGSGGAVAATANIGAACEADDDCGTGLVCITTSSTIFGTGGPAGGLCSRVCAGDTECGSNAYCVPFEEDATTGYCIEACQLGTAGEPKCHQRNNVACGLLGLVPTTVACTSIDDCTAGQLCDTDEGTCGDVIPGCLPTCAGDFDCEEGQYCSFASGLCTEGTPSGLAVGERCDPSAATDPCAGFCSATNEEGTEGVCSALCALNPDLIGCGNSGEDTPDAACLFATLLSEGDAGTGDVGLCGALCDCNDDCNAENDRCMDETDGGIQSLLGRGGYCRPLASDETESDSIACE